MATPESEKSNYKRWKQVAQIFAAYLVGAWTFLEFLDWILSRYSLSPYWVELLLWVFIGIIPSLLIYLFHHERINQKSLRLREKIIFPLNILVLAVGLYFGFGTTDLGATTKAIEYTTESGEKRTALITKEEFRTGFYIYNFEPKVADSTTAWLEFGIPVLLNEDLLQNKNLKPDAVFIDNTAEKVKEASYFYDFYIDGDYEVTDSLITLNTYIRKAKNAKVIMEKTFKGNDILDLIDDATVFITQSLDSDEFNNPSYLDLPIKEITSSNLKALEYFRYGDYENAVKEDSTFALAYLFDGRRNVIYSRSKTQEQSLADKAYEYRQRMPLQRQSEALVLRYLAYDQFEEAEKLVKIQLEVDPTSDIYNNTLKNIYGRTKNLKAYTQMAMDAWDNQKDRESGLSMIEAGLIQEEYDAVINQIDAFSLLQPNDDVLFAFKLMPELLKGDIEAARETHERIKLLYPDLQNKTRVYDSVLAYLEENPAEGEDLQKFEGEYRSESSEQTFTFWPKGNTVLKYTSGQRIRVLIRAGDHRLVSGHPLIEATQNYDFLWDDKGQYYGVKFDQIQADVTDTFWYWKQDETIKKAESLLQQRQLDEAKSAYENAIKANPRHYYLKTALEHIDYVLGMDSTALITQLKGVSGTYSIDGNESVRKFWIEDGRLMYKRDGLPGKELLPISETSYISMSGVQIKYSFEYENEAVIASYVWRFNAENMSWEENYMPDINYLPKD
ncbi:tetratricopeptide repeat protein [Robiginitalea aurantiaca]|uniref:Tetratricopeptide repeat protein n=1 Tax=Robiginitalea aurantiaca TaxID=3056915 RepID=A0ABT7WDW6_9FLAO|nr:hypothetical protein [Robiginitalea aurantiaca]MDM9631106.1 hypothetical protein [Robiginitalea aurantiaca]